MRGQRLSPSVAPAVGAPPGRWAATAVTYGLTGRIIATIVVTLPILLFLPVLIPYGLAGLVAYFVVYPRALRQIWRRADRRP